MKAHDGVVFAVVEGTFLPEALEATQQLVKDDGGTCTEAAVPPPNTDFIIVPRLAQAADAALVSRLIGGDLEEWRGITLVTGEWIKLSTEMALKFKELYDEYEISGTKDVRVEAELDFSRRPIPIGPGLIVDVEELPQDNLSLKSGSINGDADRPPTPLVQSSKEDTAVDDTPKPGYPFPASTKNADPTSPGTRSPPSELGSTLSAPPTPTKSKSKNAQRKAARKRAKNKKKNLGELEETEGEDESTTTDQSKAPQTPQEPELTVWDRVRNLKNKDVTSSITDREREQPREQRAHGTETPMGTPVQTIQLQTFNDIQQCNWCGNTHNPAQSFEIWERVANDVFPDQTILDNIYINNATSSRTGWCRAPRREQDKPALSWESIRDVFTPASPQFFTDELFDAYIRCLNDHLQVCDIKALVLGTAYWTELLDECMHRHPARGPVSQYGLIRVGHTDLSFSQYDRIIFPIRLGHLWSVAILDVEHRVVVWYDAFGSNQLNKGVASKIARILDVLVITDPDVGSFDWKVQDVHEAFAHEPVNYSGIHAALSCEILARQGTHNDHLIQWLMVEFRRTWHSPSVPKTVPESWLLRAIRWVVLICAKGGYWKDAWEADMRCSKTQSQASSVQGRPVEVKGLEIIGLDSEAATVQNKRVISRPNETVDNKPKTVVQ